MAIDRATRWVYLEILNDKSARSAQGFLKRLYDKVPFIRYELYSQTTARSLLIGFLQAESESQRASIHLILSAQNMP